LGGFVKAETSVFDALTSNTNNCSMGNASRFSNQLCKFGRVALPNGSVNESFKPGTVR